MRSRHAVQLLAVAMALGELGCGTSHTNSAAPRDAGGVDGTFEASSSDGSLADASTTDASVADAPTEGCSPADEATNDGGCVAVVPAGARALAMEVNPPTGL